MKVWSDLRRENQSKGGQFEATSGGKKATSTTREQHAPIEVAKVVRRVHPGEERPVEPPTTLRDEVGESIWHVLPEMSGKQKGGSGGDLLVAYSHARVCVRLPRKGVETLTVTAYALRW